MKKHQHISNQLKADLLGGSYKIGDKLVGEHALSQRFKASRQTVRQALATLERDGFVERVHGSGTYVRRTTQQDKTARQTICVMTTYVDTYIFPSIISGIEQVLSEAGFDMTLKLTRNNTDSERANLLSLESSSVCGLIVEGTQTALPNPNIDLYNSLKDLPVIFINSYYRELDPDKASYVVVDDQDGARQGVRHLIENGHQNIGGIFKSDDMQGRDRYKGFQAEIEQAGLPFDPNRTIWYTTKTEQETFSVDHAEQILTTLQGCTAVVCYNDEVAARLSRILATRNLAIPDDLSVISFDDSDLARLTPPGICSLTHPGSELGQAAARAMLEKLDRPDKVIQQTLGTKLIKRQSVRRL